MDNVLAIGTFILLISQALVPLSEVIERLSREAREWYKLAKTRSEGDEVEETPPPPMFRFYYSDINILMLC